MLSFGYTARFRGIKYLNTKGVIHTEGEIMNSLEKINNQIKEEELEFSGYAGLTGIAHKIAVENLLTHVFGTLE